MISEVMAKVILIVSALPDETLAYENLFDQSEWVGSPHAGHRRGLIADREIISAYCGVGKVKAALITANLIKQFDPAVVLTSGCAGSINRSICQEGDVTIGTEIIDWDLGDFGVSRKPFTFYDTPTSLSALFPTNFGGVYQVEPELIQPAFLTAVQNASNGAFRVGFNKIATSDRLPNPPEQYQQMAAGKDIAQVAMECIGIASACHLNRIPCVPIRGVSNYVEEDFTWDKLVMAGRHAAITAVALIRAWLSQSSMLL